MTALRDEFLLDPEIAFLNHGSFGACPRPVFEEYQRWQRELERNPVDFLFRRLHGLLGEARAVLADYVGADPADLVFVPNATHGLNLVARALALEPGDEVVATDHEYGAVNLMWRFLCARAGATYVRVPVEVPVSSAEAVAEAVVGAIGRRTRVVVVSHITSPTALVFPVAEICLRARGAGSPLVVVDGAHAPGHVAVDLRALGADVYVGNCHKWLCAPKGSGFVWVAPDHHELLHPLVLSWGLGEEEQTFVTRGQTQGTLDPAAYLAVPDAIAYQAARDWDAQRRRCHDLASEARTLLADVTGEEPLAPDSPEWFCQMVASLAPVGVTPELGLRLFREHGVEVSVRPWNERTTIRVSFQAYNDARDLERLDAALRACLGR